ncbi:MAG: DIP1984 family protein [Chloracidobacterium sp.]|nr:DIP1984 family protein [Chloracidobacterium sp.]
MKLAEALILRSDIQKRIEQLRHRLTNNAKVQEGDAPAEKPDALLKELEGSAVELEKLIKRINKTNSKTEFAKGRTLTDALAERDVLLLRKGVYSGLVNAATVTQQLYSRSEIKFVATVNVGRTQKQADALAKQYRELDAKIQEFNWKTDLAG